MKQNSPYHIPREMQISLEKDKTHQEIGEMWDKS